MNRTFKILLVVLFTVIVVQSVAVVVIFRRNSEKAKSRPVAYVIAYPRFDWSALSPGACVELISALKYDEISFNNRTLQECLKQFSDKTYGILGKGFSFSIKGLEGIPGLPDSRISLKLKNVTFAQILKALGEASGATIEVTECGVFATYGRPGEKKP